ncbi:MAG TPA: DUF3592 domain-containing protein [Thermoanaerobaculia bacterium]|nr:DUF3592 domain-containing protein [Thermoanaerobaculia bacterium]
MTDNLRSRSRVQSSGSGVPKWIGFPLVFFGIVLLADIIFRDVSLAVRGQRVPGVITGLRRSSRARGPTTPQVTFRTAGGSAVTFDGFGRYGAYEVGQRVKVLYLPQSPRSSAQIESWPTFWYGVSVCLVLGFGMLAGGIAILRRSAS